MVIELERINDAFHMKATNDTGNEIFLDGSEAIGGGNLGFRPMQLLLAGIGGCSAIDMIDILRKQRQPIAGLKIKVEGHREEGKVPSLFKEIHVHFTVSGDVEPEKAVRAAKLSFDKYCSVAKTLEPTANITHSVEVVK